MLRYNRLTGYVTSGWLKLLNNLMRKLIIILLVAAVLRLVGTYPGYSPYHPDEDMSYTQGMSMILDKTLDANGYPLHYAYPNVVPLTNAIIFKSVFLPISWTSYFVNNISKIVDGFIKIPLSKDQYELALYDQILGHGKKNVLTWGRTITAFFGIGIVWFVYLIAKKNTSKEVALLAAFLTAVNYRLVLNSHFALPDIYNTFFFLMTFWFCTALIEKPEKSRYLLAGLSVGVFLSTKFQILGLVMLFVSHFFVVIKTRRLYFKHFLLAIFISVFVFLLLNPYHLIHIEKTIYQVQDAALKYRIAKYALDFYPLSYLVRIGVGPVASLLAIVGSVFMLKHKFKTLLLLVVPIVFTFYMYAFYTGGGFYTRNLLLAIPFILILAAVASIEIYKVVPKKISIIVLAVLLVASIFHQLDYSLIVARSYSSPWNFKTLSDWLSGNVASGSVIGSHPFVPLPIEDVERIEQQVAGNFSLQEMQNLGADWVVLNLDLVTGEHYWWMTGSTQDSLRFWNKPTNIMENGYAAMAAREYSQYAAFTPIKPWQVADSNFIVSKIPVVNYKVSELVREFDFNNSTQGWTQQGVIWSNDKNQEYRDGSLMLDRFQARSAYLRWDSPVIDISHTDDITIKALIQTSTLKDHADGFIAAKLYKSEADAEDDRMRNSVYLSSKNESSDIEKEQMVAFRRSEEENFLVLSFQTLDPSKAQSRLNQIQVYNSDVTMDFGNSIVKKVDLDPNILFLESHGGL